MPTADTYWIAADDFEALAGGLADDAQPLGASLTDDVVVGGRLRPTLDEAMAAVVDGIAATAESYRALADECRRRALACHAYTDALADHHAARDAWLAMPDAERTATPPSIPPRREPWMLAG